MYGSDKWGQHWYAQHYERHFSPLRKKPLVVLEIGIGGYDNPHSGGPSLRMWKSYFPKSRIYGVDIYDKSPHDEDRIRTFVGDQSDEEFLTKLISEIGRPDIVIDDGSHISKHVIKSFEVLFPLMADDGIYVIEDLSTSYWPHFGGSSENMDSAQTSMGMLKRLADGLNHKEFMLSDYQQSYFDENIVSVHFYHNLVFCYKGKNLEKAHRQF
jgi:23S rRNA U2552 (ribose-2'-O)-methylase RlmE/FtsJ